MPPFGANPTDLSAIYENERDLVENMDSNTLEEDTYLTQLSLHKESQQNVRHEQEQRAMQIGNVPDFQ